MDNPWFITIAGGLVVALITRAFARPPQPYVLELLIALGLFGMLQLPILMIRQTGPFEAVVIELGEHAYWLFFESAAVIVVAVVLDKRKNR